LIKSNLISHLDDLHVEGFAVLFFLLGLNAPWFFIVLGVYVVLVIKKLKIMLIIILFSVLLIRFYLWYQEDIPQRIDGNVKVLEVIDQEFYDVLIIRYQQIKFKLSASPDLYHEGDILYVKGEIKSFKSMTIPHGFDLNTYHLSQNIKGYVEDDEVRIIDHEPSLFHLRSLMEDQMNDHQSSLYLKAFILGEKAFSDEENALFGSLGILYLFSISGMHIYMFLLMMRKIFFYLSLSKKTQDTLTLLIYLVFFYLNGFSFGVFRLLLMFIFKWINQKYELELTRLDGIQITFFLLMIINIHYIFHQGVLITYLILNMLYLTEFLYQGQKGYLKKLMMSTLIFFVILPFSNQVSLLMLITLPIFIFLFTGPLFIGALLVLLIPELDVLYYQGIVLFESMLSWMNQKNVGIHLPSMDSYMVLVYFLLFVYVLRSRSLLSVMKRSLILGIVLCSPFIKFIHPTETYVFFLDVGQGDSIYIENKTCKLMIDSYHHTASFLKNRGVYTLDYLILTHSDEDHIKESMDIIDQIQVNHLVLSAFIDDYPSYAISKLLMKAGDHLTCGNLELNFLSPLRFYENRNLNSLVFQIEINQKIFLFTGDIEEEVEIDLVNRYGSLLKSDVLKVAHHGSITSTSKAFIEHVNPEIAVISVGYENKFKFPSETVLQRLREKNVILYRTDLQGTILFKSDEKKEKWSHDIPFPSRI
jgi:competence protein ComEC